MKRGSLIKTHLEVTFLRCDFTMIYSGIARAPDTVSPYRKTVKGRLMELHNSVIAGSIDQSLWCVGSNCIDPKLEVGSWTIHGLQLYSHLLSYTQLYKLQKITTAESNILVQRSEVPYWVLKLLRFVCPTRVIMARLEVFVAEILYMGPAMDKGFELLACSD